MNYADDEVYTASFTAKRITLTEGDNTLQSLPTIIKKQEMQDIFTLRQFMHDKKARFDTDLAEQERQILEQAHESQRQQEEESWQKTLNALADFEDMQVSYFDLIEQNSLAIVKAAMESLLQTTFDEDKASAAIISALAAAKQESRATVVVHPSNSALVHQLARDKKWDIWEDDEVGSDSCIVKIAMGEYHHSFEGNVNSLTNMLSNI